MPVTPIAQPRQRHSVRGGKPRCYVPSAHPVHEFKEAIRAVAWQEMNGDKFDGALFVRFAFLLPRTKAVTYRRKPMPRLWHAKKPDLDNIVKAAKDAMTDIVWRDDSQVVKCEAEKFIAAGTEIPLMAVSVEEIGGAATSWADSLIAEHLKSKGKPSVSVDAEAR